VPGQTDQPQDRGEEEQRSHERQQTEASAVDPLGDDRTARVDLEERRQVAADDLGDVAGVAGDPLDGPIGE
jgi:hypothetical protein